MNDACEQSAKAARFAKLHAWSLTPRGMALQVAATAFVASMACLLMELTSTLMWMPSAITLTCWAVHEIVARHYRVSRFHERLTAYSDGMRDALGIQMKVHEMWQDAWKVELALRKPPTQAPSPLN